MNYNDPNNLIIICGCPGGGTSYVTKLLRFSGFAAGDDAGDLDDRKFHESLFFKNINKEILSSKKIPKIIWDTNDLPKAIKVFADNKAVHELYLNKYLNNKKIFDRRMIASHGGQRGSGPWGWKDPRNSITLPFWLKIFPGARVLFITKKHNKHAVGISKSGKAFIASDKELRQFYFKPPYFDEKIDHLTISFEEVTVNFNKFNELLCWIGLCEISNNSFESLLYSTKFEGTIKCI